MNEGLDFSAPAETHEFDGLLFDNDGTIIDSTAAIEKHWFKSVIRESQLTTNHSNKLTK